MGEFVKEVSDSNFEEEILKSGTPCLVDFWAPWCGPCKMIAPILDELAKEYDGKIKIAKMNVDDNPKTPTKYKLRGIPTLILIKDGELVNQIVGFVQKEAIEAAISELLV